MKKYVMHDCGFQTDQTRPVYGGPRLHISALLASERKALSILQEVQQNMSDSSLEDELRHREQFVQDLHELQSKLLDH